MACANSDTITASHLLLLLLLKTPAKKNAPVP
jgi:hypothetical protein